jgi:hypothetical protein
LIERLYYCCGVADGDGEGTSPSLLAGALVSEDPLVPAGALVSAGGFARLALILCIASSLCCL